jgi:pimeloyl-ACP methyl ester carboxylesterase
MFAPITITIPEGSILHPAPDAAVVGDVAMNPIDVGGDIGSDVANDVAAPQGDGPLPVVLVHGFAGSNDAFINDERSCYASWLNRNGFSVLCPDLHGAGHSDGPDTAYSSELFVEQLAELCLAFGLQRPFDLVGFSMGGSVAVQFAYRYPHLVRRLVLQAPHVIETPLRLALRVALRVAVSVFAEGVAAALPVPLPEAEALRATTVSVFAAGLDQNEAGDKEERCNAVEGGIDGGDVGDGHGAGGEEGRNVYRRGRRNGTDGGAVPIVRGTRSKISHPVGDERAEDEREIRERAAE